MADVLLLGLVHRDPQGMTRLHTALTALMPRVITVEVSPFALAYRHGESRWWLRRLRRWARKHHPPGTSLAYLDGLEAYLAWPFEVRGALRHGRDAQIPLWLIDDSAWSWQHLKTLPALLHPHNLRTLRDIPSPPLQDEVAAAYRLARWCLDDPPPPGLVPEPEEPRERAMAASIRARLPSRGRLIHIAGWTHLVDQPHTLFHHLRDLRPQRLLLSSFPPEDRTTATPSTAP